MSLPLPYIDDISLREGWIVDRKCPLPGSIYANKERYRFGFNGKENDSEVEGQQDYGLRIYDRRLGRFKSPDPIIVQGQMYPELSAYQFASNTPISAIDLDGAEARIVVNKFWTNTSGEVQTMRTTSDRIQRQSNQTHINMWENYGNEERFGDLGTLVVFVNLNEGKMWDTKASYRLTTKERISRAVQSFYKKYDNPEGGIAFYSKIGQGQETKSNPYAPMESVDEFMEFFGVNDANKVLKTLSFGSKDLTDIAYVLKHIDSRAEIIKVSKDVKDFVKNIEIKDTVCIKCNGGYHGLDMKVRNKSYETINIIDKADYENQNK